MADIYKGELQDNLGNTVYPHTEADVVFCADGKTAQEKLAGYENALGGVTGTSSSLEVNDANILATTEATKKLDNKFGGYNITTKDGKIAYYKESEGADSAVPFKSGGGISPNKVFIQNRTELGNIQDFSLGTPTTATGYYLYFLFNVSELQNFKINVTGNVGAISSIKDDVVTPVSNGGSITSADYIMVVYVSASVSTTIGVTFTN